MNATPTPSGAQAAKLERLLKESGGTGRLARYRGWLILALIALLLAALAYALLRGGNDAAAPAYLTEAAAVGKLVVKVSATGNLQPTNQVDVGSELSGIVDKVFVDENDLVKRGEVLARLDRSKLQDAVAKSRANLAAAEAQVLQMQATLAEARANLARFRQVAELSGGKVPSKAELDRAEADLKRAEANQASARASVTQAQATLQSDETNLAKAHIRSPIDGVVLARKVEPGQTVAASFQAPVLFTLAEDLARMELHVDVDEADVGRVEAGQQATFSVDAWPDRQYTAVITRVGYGSQVKDGVVSYLTVLRVDNDDQSLRPGMTGTAEITTLVRNDVLLVPNAALRFSPSQTATQARRSGGLVGMMMPRPPRTQSQRQQASDEGAGPRVWVLRDGQPAPLAIKTGASNGKLTEVVGGELLAGMEVITEAVAKQP